MSHVDAADPLAQRKGARAEKGGRDGCGSEEASGMEEREGSKKGGGHPRWNTYARDASCNYIERLCLPKVVSKEGASSGFVERMDGIDLNE